jgi:hypothetical protein
MTTQQISTALRAMILAGLEPELGSRVYHTGAPISAELPLCVVRIEADTPEAYLTSDRRVIRFVVHLHVPLESGPAALAPLSDALYTALHRQVLAGEGSTAGEVACLDRGRATPGRRSYFMTSRWRLGSDE